MTTETLRRPRHVKVTAPVRHAGPPTVGRRSPWQLLAVAAAACAVVLGAGAASGYLNGLMSGRGTATVAGPPAFAASVDAGPGEEPDDGAPRLLPGGTVPVQVQVTNPFDRPLVVTDLVPSGPTSLVVPAPGCNPVVVSFAVTVLPATPLLPGAQTFLEGTLAMSVDAPSACQGASFRVPLTVQGRLT